MWQLVCSPFRKPLDRRERLLVRALFSRAAGIVTTALARAAGAPDPRATWTVHSGPTFHNSIGLLEIEGRTARVAIRRSGTGDDGPTFLAGLHAMDLS